MGRHPGMGRRRGGGPALLVSLAAALASAACTSLVGFPDLPVPEEAGTDATAGDTGGDATLDAPEERAGDAADAADGTDGAPDAPPDVAPDGPDASCGPATCASGCCTSTGTCATPSNASCGLNGVACVPCAADQECDAQGRCVCDANTCPGGCCDAAGHCVTANNDGACGLGGVACVACVSGQACNASGACVCDATSCPSGCCDASEHCQTPSSATCGTGGASCVACVSGQECSGSGVCACDATSCPSGCCNGAICVPYASQSPGQCGAGGSACAACASGQGCSASGACICDAVSCPSGCCSGATCEAYSAQSSASCGTAGAACAACTTSTPYCDTGVCSATPPSCAPGGAGMTNCGAGGSGSESCCTSLSVTGGTYYRSYTNNGGGPTGEADPATVSGLRVDKYLVTVGRFRQFRAAWSGGWLPSAGSGKHTYLNGGQGLANSGSAGTYEAGWDATDWNNTTDVDPTDANLACNASYSTWTPSAGSQENLPINCVNWWESYAFCIWDGGFLPSEAEWEYVSAGGSQQREYPWGTAAPGMANQYAIYGCYYPSSSGSCSDVSNIAPVGYASQGAGLWGQLDMAGEVFEWNLDWYASYVDPCTDCAYLTAASSRVGRGGYFNFTASSLLPPYRYDTPPTYRDDYVGFRCARTP